MQRKTRLFVLIAICLVFVCVGVYRWNVARVAASQLDDTDYAKLYTQATTSGRPTVVFITMSEGCCEGTIVVLDGIRTSVIAVTKEFDAYCGF